MAQKCTLQQSIVDFFLISDVLSIFVTNADIKPGYRTYHSMITLTSTLGKESKTNYCLHKKL